MEGSPAQGSHIHGIKSPKMPEGGNTPMTGGRRNKRSRENLESLNNLHMLPSRPNLTTQQSNSLPSTPYVHARELSETYPVPSPISKAAEAVSPRSARSESDSTLRPPGRTPYLTGCKHETGMAFSRRRIPYSLGGDKLEPSPRKVKKHLEASEEETLSGDMEELYGKILPSPESEDRRARFLVKLERILNDRWPGNNIKVHVFGSTGNLLYTSDSDGTMALSTISSDDETYLISGYLYHYTDEGSRACLYPRKSLGRTYVSPSFAIFEYAESW